MTPALSQARSAAFAPRSLRCHFCGDVATGACRWPVSKPLEAVHVSALRVGDWIYPCKVSEPREIVHIDTEFGDIGTFTIYIAAQGEPWSNVTTLRRLANDVLYRPTRSTCGQPCCYRHARQVDDDRDYCRDHWRQEDIA